MTSQRPSFARIAMGACLILSFLALSAESGGSQTIVNWNKARQKAFKKYQKMPRHKAFAVSSATFATGRQSSGWADEMSSKAAARAEAIRQCRLAGGTGGCVVKTSE